jgi:hypothetical protein
MKSDWDASAHGTNLMMCEIFLKQCRRYLDAVLEHDAPAKTVKDPKTGRNIDVTPGFLVSDDGRTTFQHPCTLLRCFLSPVKVELEAKGLIRKGVASGQKKRRDNNDAHRPAAIKAIREVMVNERSGFSDARDTVVKAKTFPTRLLRRIKKQEVDDLPAD